MEDFDGILKAIAREMSSAEEVERLGTALGIPIPDIQGYKVESQDNGAYGGTLKLFRDWRKTQTSSTQKEALRHALREAGRNDLCERYFSRPDDFKRSVEAQPNDADGNETELKDLREKVKNYRPGQNTGIDFEETLPTVINIGLFGVTAVGKSAFINSLNFAMRGEYETVAAEADHSFMGAKTLFRDAVCLTDHIHILDNRPMKDYSLKQIKDSLIPQFCGRRGLDPNDKITNGRVVHCPVFISDFTRNPAGRETMLDFLESFSQSGYGHSGCQMMIVATNKESLGKDFQTQRERLHSRIRIPEDNIWVFENYTENYHEHDEARSIEYLKFLLKCLDVAERNAIYEMKRSKEKDSLWHGIRQRLNGKTAACLLFAVFIHFIFMSQVSLNTLPFLNNKS